MQVQATINGRDPLSLSRPRHWSDLPTLSPIPDTGRAADSELHKGQLEAQFPDIGFARAVQAKNTTP